MVSDFEHPRRKMRTRKIRNKARASRFVFRNFFMTGLYEFEYIRARLAHFDFLGFPVR
jgi:hypothetical protein